MLNQFKNVIIYFKILFKLKYPCIYTSKHQKQEVYKMDMNNTNLIGGNLQISTDVIAKIAKCAALEVKGVTAVACGAQNRKVNELLEAASIRQAVTVEMKDGIAVIGIQLVVSFGTRIPSVAEKVQENVKNAVQNMTSVAVSRVNITIAGLAEPVAEVQTTQEDTEEV